MVRMTRQAALAIALSCGLLSALLAWMYIDSNTGERGGTMPATNVVTIGDMEIFTETNDGQTYDVDWLDPWGNVQTFRGITRWCEMGGTCHGSALHFVDPKTGVWLAISGTYRCARVDRVEK